MPRAALVMLGDLYADAGSALAPRAAQIRTLIDAPHGDAHRFRPHDLEDVLPAIARQFVAHGTRGWLFGMRSASRPSVAFQTASGGRLIVDVGISTASAKPPKTLVKSRAMRPERGWHASCVTLAGEHARGIGP